MNNRPVKLIRRTTEYDVLKIKRKMRKRQVPRVDIRIVIPKPLYDKVVKICDDNDWTYKELFMKMWLKYQMKVKS